MVGDKERNVHHLRLREAEGDGMASLLFLVIFFRKAS